MTVLARRTAIGSAFLAGAFLVIFLGFLSPDGGAVRDAGVGVTGHGVLSFPEELVANVPIPKGTRVSAIIVSRNRLLSTTSVRSNNDATIFSPYRVRNDIAIRTISAGEPLTAADFALHRPIYYPRGYPKSVPASEVPGWIRRSNWLGPPQSGAYLEVVPGVWMDGSPSEAVLDEHVANGTLIGYCRSVRAFQAHNPRIPFARKCWRK